VEGKTQGLEIGKGGVIGCMDARQSRLSTNFLLGYTIKAEKANID
jgi:hypothetical protein